jgi:hypothetical protein
VEAEVDETLILDLARIAAHSVERRAAPVTTYLLGFAAGTQGAGPAELELLASQAQTLADGWDRSAADDAAPGLDESFEADGSTPSGR